MNLNLIVMKKNVLIISILFLLFFGSCIPSLFPLYFEKDLITNSDLIGNWNEDGSENTWAFYPDEDEKSYNLWFLEKDNNNIEDGTLGIFETHLFKLGDNYYFDFYPGENKDLEKEINTLMSFHLVTAHTFAKVNISKDTIIIQQFDIDYLEDLLENGKIRIKHVRLAGDNNITDTNEGVVLTASTRELQEFFIKYSEDEDAFTDPITLIKNKE